MRTSSSADFDPASASEAKLLARLRSDDMANQMRERLRELGLRPTRTRVALSNILFAKGDRHISAEMLFEEASKAKVPVSLATVYNTLHQFTEVGLLRQIAVDSSKSYFDTNNTEHHHYYLEDRHELMDIPPTDLRSAKFPYRRRATKSLASTWSCACGARLSTLRRQIENKGRLPAALSSVSRAL
jgi:Fur family transcriptional regulator, iron response regulator